MRHLHRYYELPGYVAFYRLLVASYWPMAYANAARSRLRRALKPVDGRLREGEGEREENDVGYKKRVARESPPPSSLSLSNQR
jgi:hypothetical protein